MTYTLRPARRSEAKPLIGIYAESGAGKTFSSLLLARGFVGPEGRIAMIETEGGRGEAFCDLPEIGGYDVVSLRDNFSPVEYGNALTAIEKAAPDAVIIDSASHEWEGAGGVLDMASRNQADGKKGVLVWQQPKMLHQRHFMLRLMQTPIPLVIVCMRAKYPMKEVQKPGGGKEWVRLETLEPKQSDDILFEMFVHGWIDHEHRLHTTKLTRRDLADVFVNGQPISLATGERLAAWARGESSPARDPDAPARDNPMVQEAFAAARQGTDAYRAWYRDADRDRRGASKWYEDEIKKIVAEADAAAATKTGGSDGATPSPSDGAIASAGPSPEAASGPLIPAAPRDMPKLSDADGIQSWCLLTLDDIRQQRDIETCREFAKGLEPWLTELETDSSMKLVATALREEMERRLDALQPGQEKMEV